MQIDLKRYDPALHDLYRALSVRQPYADLLTREAWREADGTAHAAKSIEVRSRNTNYRGDLLICASAQPSDLPGHLAGCTCGLVELYGVKPISEFTEQDWQDTCIPEGERPKEGYGWLMRNPRRVVEMPIKGALGIYRLAVPKGDITEYPHRVSVAYAVRKEGGAL